MTQYAGDYSKYMGGGGQQGGSQGGFQQYMTQYAGDYSKYMGGGGGSQGGSQGGYQQYMTQYAGDYSKYMGGGDQKGSSQAGTELLTMVSKERPDEKAGGSVEKSSKEQGSSQGGYQQYM